MIYEIFKFGRRYKTGKEGIGLGLKARPVVSRVLAAGQAREGEAFGGFIVYGKRDRPNC